MLAGTRVRLMAAAYFAFVFGISATPCLAQDADTIGIGKWFTFTANVPQSGYRKTQFFAPNWKTVLIEWDSRAEFWLPPGRDMFAWGPYIRMAGIAGYQGDYSGVPPEFQSDAWQKAWLGAPGLGIQIYPFSSWRFQSKHDKLSRIVGPVRAFAEYNRTDYWGAGNQWRPRSQSRSGMEYWKATNVNDPSRALWAEVWNGLYWQSSNEFTDRYDSVIFANSWRTGIRKPKKGMVSALTPYLAIDSSLSKYRRTGPTDCFLAPATLDPLSPNPCDFYWENRLRVGGGARFAPSLSKLEHNNRAWFNRFVIYAEYTHTATYYGPSAPSWVPRFDLSVGASVSIGQWYK